MRFGPDSIEAQALDAAMHRELGLSLDHVIEATDGALPFDADALRCLTKSLGDGTRFPPAVFSLYYELVSALTRDDRAASEALFARLAAAEPADRALEITTLDTDGLGIDAARFASLLNESGEDAPAMIAADAAAIERFRPLLASAMQLLERELPELSDEIRALVRQIILVGSDPSARYQLDGGTHYQLWGALFLNVNFHDSPLAVAEVLAHESGHLLLFGKCIEMALIDNPPEETFRSPLRADARPMDGIFHATFVSARMHWAMARLAQSATLSAAERKVAAEAARSDARNFWDGYGIVRTHAHLTPLGAALIDDALHHMRAAGTEPIDRAA